ncbi:MAG: hypothetical protein JRI23_08665, partial [Deltaproteobacteria bacterium]|nr:hypothetical protein [Deltaproteobacteria bacterium]MBW2531685.1 hypothetical protein [Deltaproteobacteria bacterium]
MKLRITTALIAIAIVGCRGDETGGTTTTSGSSSSSSSSTSGTGGCDIDFVQTWGSEQACNDCVAENCCSVAEAFEADPTAQTYQSLDACASHCREDCDYLVCDSALV